MKNSKIVEMKHMECEVSSGAHCPSYLIYRSPSLLLLQLLVRLII